MNDKISIDTKIRFWCLLFSAAAVQVALHAALCAAALLPENSRTLEVRLDYRTAAEIDISTGQFERQGETLSESAVFSVARNRGEVRGAASFPGGVIAVGTFGVRVFGPAVPGGAGAGGSAAGFGRIFSACRSAGLFNGIVNAVEFDGETVYLGTAAGDIVEIGESRARRIAVIRSRGRFGVNRLKKSDGALLVSTEGGGLYVFDGRTIHALSEATRSILSDSVRDALVFPWKDGTYLAVATMRGVSVLRVKKLGEIDYEKAGDFRTEGAAETLAFAGGRLYAGGVFGAISVDPGDWTAKKLDAFRDTYVKSIFADPAGEKLFAATHLSGIFEFPADGSRRERAVPLSSLGRPGEVPRIRFALPRAGAFLVAGESGLFTAAVRGHSGGFQLDPAAPALSDRISCAAAHSGKLYFGTFDEGVFSMDGSGKAGALRFQAGSSLSSAHVNALASFGGYLLVGTSAGLDAVSTGTGNIKALGAGLSDPHVNCIHVSGNRAYVGTSNGITVVSSDLSCEAIKFDPARIDRHVYSIFRDPVRNVVYLGTYRGFGILAASEKSLAVLTMMNSDVPDNWVTAIHPLEGGLVVGTYDKGIAMFDPVSRKFSRFPGKNPAPSKMINQNAFFSHGKYLMIGTYNGGFSIVDTAAREGRNSRHFNLRGGISGDCVTCFAEDGGKIYAGTHSGITIFDASSIPSLFE